MLRRSVAIAALLTSVHAVSPAADGFSTYDIMGPMGDCAHVSGINAHSAVVGAEFCGGGSRGFVWMPRRGVRIVSDFETGWEDAHLAQVNDHGVAVGYGTVQVGTDMGVHRAMLMPAKGSRVALAHLGTPEQSSDAVAINNGGVVIGHVGFTGNYALFNVRWNPDGTAERLDLPPYTAVRAINAQGAIAYTSFGDDTSYLLEPSGTRHAFQMPAVTGLNDNGNVVGWDNRGGLVWSAERGLERLPGPPDRPKAVCTTSGINNQDQVVGECSKETSRLRAVIWQRIDGVWQIASLPQLVRHGALRKDRYSWTYGINDAGHILLQGVTSDSGGAMILVPLDAPTAPAR